MIRGISCSSSVVEESLLSVSGSLNAKTLASLRSMATSHDGSSIEQKESAIVWHHQEADPDFGSWQAKELLDHLESVLVNEPVVVKNGQQIVEVKPQGVSKGVVVKNLMTKYYLDDTSEVSKMLQWLSVASARQQAKQPQNMVSFEGSM